MKTEKERLIEALETVIMEKKKITTSKEYKLAKKINETKKKIRHFEIKGIIGNIKKKIGYYRRKKYESKYENMKYTNLGSVNDKKIVVYTCIAGEYDKVSEPLYKNDNVEYVIYTNSKEELIQWKKRDIPLKLKEINSNILINRYIKLHPHELFEEYDYSIYIDGNIRSMSDLSDFTRAINEKSGLAMFKHHTRNCIYIEEKVCNIYGKGNKEKLHKQTQKYKKEGFPENYGMLEGNIIVTDLKNKKSNEILGKWWNEFEKSESLRDQMSLPYVLWKLGYKIEDIGILGNNVYSCSKFEFVKHLK